MYRKEWRRIVVDNQEYRWRVDNIPTGDGTIFLRNLIMYPLQTPASRCVIHFNQIGYFWWGDATHPVIVTPRLVAQYIQYALQAGWDTKLKKAYPLNNGTELWAKFSTLPGSSVNPSSE